MAMRSFSRRDLLKGSAITAGAAMVGSPAALAQRANEAQAPDLAMVNGKILTLDGQNTIASALAIRNGRIVEVGKGVGGAVRTIDLKGATVIPGLIDAHHHIYWSFDNPGREARDIELARSMREFLQAISERARTVPAGQFITCNGGWTRDCLKEKRLPTLAELDTAAPNHPLWLAETQSEAAWIDSTKTALFPALTNSLGLAFFQKQGIKGDAATGAVPWPETTAVLQKLDTEEERLNDAIDFAVGLGVTMLHDFGNSRASDPSLDAAYPYVIDRWREQKLKLRFRMRIRAPSGSGTQGLKARMVNGVARLGDDVLRLNGFGEGLGGGTQEGFVESAKLVAEHGWSAHVHSVDIPENTAHIAGYRAANAVRSLKELRWSLAHVNSITPELVATLKEMGVGVTAEGAYGWTDLQSWPVPGPPWRMLVDSGIHVGAGSDGTGAAGFNPWLTIYYMTTGRNIAGVLANPGQTLSRMEALKVHSLGSAWHSFDDHHLGTLEVGKLADLAVLSDDVLTVSDDNLRRIRSQLTLQAGKIVHQVS